MATMTSDTCPIWGTPAQYFEDVPGMIRSARAGGDYRGMRAAHWAKGLGDHEKARLTSWLVEQRLLGNECSEVTKQAIEDAERRKPLPVHERAERLLKYLAGRSDKIGQAVRFSRFENPDDVEMEMRAWSETVSREEIIFLLTYMEKNDWIGTVYSKSEVSIVVSVPGYAHLAELEKGAVDSKQAFVAVWFDDSLTAAYEDGIAPAIREAGYEPLRIDRKDHNNKIDDEIIAEIRRSRFLVADFTHGDDGPRGGVYYEAGFAHGLGIPVVFTCREDAIDKVHFDTRQYNHITWKTPDDLRTRLAQRISATIGDGPSKKSG